MGKISDKKEKYGEAQNNLPQTNARKFDKK